MSIVVIAAIWLSLGVIFCLASKRGVAEVSEPQPVAASPEARRFTTLAVHEWALAAHDVALDELFSAYPGVIRRVAAR